MAYDFTKNTANYLRWSTYNAFVNNYAGASNLIGSLWFRVRSADSGVNYNRIISTAIASGQTGFAAGVNSDGTVYVGFRSINTDSFEKHTTTRTVGIGGSEWNHLLFCVSFGTPGRIQLFLNGEWDSDRDGIFFNSGVIVPTAQTTSFDYLGADAGGATPSNTLLQFDGQIAEIAFWGIRHQSTNLPNLSTRMAKKAWYNKVTPLNTWTGISPYPYYRCTLDPTVVNGFGGRQSAADPAALTARNGVSNAYGHPPVQPGIHWAYRGRKSLILPVGSGAISGAVTATLADASLAATAKLQIQGQAAGTLGTLVAAATGTLRVAGSASVTLGDVAGAATGALLVEGVLTQTLADATLAATGSLQTLGSGVVSATLDAATLAATGTLDIQAAVSQSLANATLASTGALALAGTLSATLEDASLSSTGSLQATGSGAVAATLADATLSATGTLPIKATATPALADATLSATGALAINGSTTATLAAATSSATGALQIKGTTSVTLADATLSAAGTAQDVAIGDLSATLADATLSSSGTLAITAQVGATLGDVTLEATGDLQEEAGGTVSSTLDDATVVSTGALAIKGAATVTLADLACISTGAAAIQAVVTATLAAATLVARIRPTADIEPDVNSAWWTYTVEPDDLTYAVAADPLTYEIGV